MATVFQGGQSAASGEGIVSAGGMEVVVIRDVSDIS